MDPLETVVLDALEKFTYVSFLLSNEEKEQLLCVFLINIDVFTWNHSYMIEIDPMLTFHKLNIIPAADSCASRWFGINKIYKPNSSYCRSIATVV